MYIEEFDINDKFIILGIICKYYLKALKSDREVSVPCIFNDLRYFKSVSSLRWSINPKDNSGFRDKSNL